VLGLAAVVFAVRSADLWALVAASGGFLVAIGLALPPLVRAWLADAPAPLSRPSDFEHLLDLLCRSYGAQAGWIVGLEEGDLEVAGRGALDAAARPPRAAPRSSSRAPPPQAPSRGSLPCPSRRTAGWTG